MLADLQAQLVGLLQLPLRGPQRRDVTTPRRGQTEHTQGAGPGGQLAGLGVGEHVQRERFGIVGPFIGTVVLTLLPELVSPSCVFMALTSEL